MRHKLALEKALANLTAAGKILGVGHSPELAAFELTEALDALDEITGRKIQDDVLAKIFPLSASASSLKITLLYVRVANDVFLPANTN